MLKPANGVLVTSKAKEASWGDPDTFKTLCKSSDAYGSSETRALQIDGLGVVLQVTTQQDGNLAEALVFVPGCHIEEWNNAEGEAFGRKLVRHR
jgi:hypothetical protein